MSAQGILLKSDFRERARANDIPVARLIGFEAKEIANGRATVMLAAGLQHANPMGTLHGGILCDIADAAMGMAFASTLAPEESFTTVGLKVNFFRPIWQGQLRAEGTVEPRPAIRARIPETVLLVSKPKPNRQFLDCSELSPNSLEFLLRLFPAKAFSLPFGATKTPILLFIICDRSVSSPI